MIRRFENSTQQGLITDPRGLNRLRQARALPFAWLVICGLATVILLPNASAQREPKIQVPSLPIQSRVFSPVEFGGETLWQHLPFEFSPEFMRGEYPIPTCDHKDREYHKVVGLVWSGLNTRNAYLRAVEATCLSLQEAADEVHVFCGKSDFRRMRAETDLFPNYHQLPKHARIEHEATAYNFIRHLSKLYIEALENPDQRIFVAINFSNHGDIYVEDGTARVSYGIPSSVSKQSLTEKHLALVGMLLAPLDFVLVNGVCFSGDHNDVIVQNAISQKRVLSMRFPWVMNCHCASLTKGGFGRPTYDADQFKLFEQAVFTESQSSSVLESSLSTYRGQRFGNARLQRRFIDGFKHGQNVPSSRADKIGIYAHSIAQFQKEIVSSPRFVDEAARNFYTPKTTHLDFDSEILKEPLIDLILASQSLTENFVRQLEIEGLEKFSFAHRGNDGTGYVDQFAKEGASKTNTTTDIGDLMLAADLYDQAAVRISEKAQLGVVEPTAALYEKDITAAEADSGLRKATSEINEFLEGDLHRRQIATALINRHLLTVKMLTDPRFQSDSTTPSPVQQIWAYYRTCELYQMLPEIHPEYQRTGKGPRTIRRYLGR